MSPSSTSLSRRSVSALTLAVLVLIMVVAAVWGWAAMTKPFPSSVTLPCEEVTVQAGDRLTRDMVTVSVLNASGSAGLATKTMDALVDRSFARAKAADAPTGTKAKGIEIWSDDPRNPAVALVRRQFTKARVVDRSTGSTETSGVVVVVGTSPDKLKKVGPESIKVTKDAKVCTPPLE